MDTCRSVRLEVSMRGKLRLSLGQGWNLQQHLSVLLIATDGNRLNDSLGHFQLQCSNNSFFLFYFLSNGPLLLAFSWPNFDPNGFLTNLNPCIMYWVTMSTDFFLTNRNLWEDFSKIYLKSFFSILCLQKHKELCLIFFVSSG